MFQPEQLEQLFRTIDGRRRFTLGMPVSRGTDCPLTLLTPEGVSMLVSQGIEVKVEKGVGRTIHYEDSRYSRTGAEVTGRTATLNCDVVVYAGRLTVDEAMQLKPHAVLLTLLDSRPFKPETAQALLNRRVTVMALDRVRDHRGLYPLADILGEVSGRAAIATAVSMMADPVAGKGILIGGVAGVNPCEITILGTGMAALAAARSAIGLGGMVRLFDSDPYCLRTAIAELGPAVIGSALHPTVLGHALAAADVVIATRISRHFTIDDSVIDNMKRGVIIIDLNHREGISGVFPTLQCLDIRAALERNTEPGRNVCLINPTGTVPRTAAMAMTNDIVPIIDRIFGSGRGLMNVLKTDEGLRASTVLFLGRVVNREVADSLMTKWIDINLLLSFS